MVMEVFFFIPLGPVCLTALVPSSVTLCPPEPLVLQVEAGGEYAGIQWTRTPIALNFSNDELVDFQQTFVRTVTSEEDWGQYSIVLSTQGINTSLHFTSVNISNCSGTNGKMPRVSVVCFFYKFQPPLIISTTLLFPLLV